MHDALRKSIRGDRDGQPGWARWGRRIHLGGVVVASIAVLVLLEFFNFLGVNLSG